MQQATEISGILRSFLSAALDSYEDSWLVCPAWSTAATLYYERVAKHIESHDRELVDAFQDLLSKIRTKYRSYTEHHQHIQRVPLVRCPDAAISETLKNDCCVCLMPLESHHRIVRLRPASGNAQTCGHFLHAKCLLRLQPHSHTGKIACPMCRADLGKPPLRTWIDTEHAIPEF